MACGGSRTHLRAPLLRRSGGLGTVESLMARIFDLVIARQELRHTHASVADLERNRLDIGQAQLDLSHALIDRYVPSENAA